MGTRLCTLQFVHPAAASVARWGPRDGNADLTDLVMLRLVSAADISLGGGGGWKSLDLDI